LENNKDIFLFVMRSTLFCDITRRVVLIHCPRFGTTYRSLLQGSRNPIRKKKIWRSDR